MKTLNKFTAVSAVVATLMLGACADMQAQPNNNTGTAPQNTSSFTQFGVVQSITVVRQDAPASTTGAGAVVGGVVGGLLGNQVGGGRGNTIATVAGVAGGAVAGNQIERRTQTQQVDVFQLSVRLSNGNVQTLTQSTDNGIRVGDRVRIDNGVATRY